MNVLPAISRRHSREAKKLAWWTDGRVLGPTRGMASYGLASAGRPRSDAAEALGRDAEHAPGSVEPRRRENDVRAQIDVCKLLQEGCSPALLNTRTPVHHEIFAEPTLIEARRLHRQRDAVVTLDVAHLLSALHVAADDLFAAYPDPDAAHLRTPVRVQRHEVNERI